MASVVVVSTHARPMGEWLGLLKMMWTTAMEPRIRQYSSAGVTGVLSLDPTKFLGHA